MTAIQHALPHNFIMHGDCTRLLPELPPESVDFILTDPPYLVRFRARDGRTVRNDDNAHWVRPAFAGMSRALQPGGFCGVLPASMREQLSLSP